MRTPNEPFEMLNSKEALLEVYRQMLIVAYGKMKNRADALDIVQEAWTKILAKRDALRDADKLMQWAKTIVSNTANTAIRRKITYAEILREQAETIYARMQGGGVPLDEQMEQMEMMRCLDRLGTETRKLFLLKYYYQWKDQEISDALGLPVGTVKARIHRGKKQLRDWLGEQAR
jgi:RNA polymerase sigma-70 factor (ECF subfamily)